MIVEMDWVSNRISTTVFETPNGTFMMLNQHTSLKEGRVSIPLVRPLNPTFNKPQPFLLLEMNNFCKVSSKIRCSKEEGLNCR